MTASGRSLHLVRHGDHRCLLRCRVPHVVFFNIDGLIKFADLIRSLVVGSFKKPLSRWYHIRYVATRRGEDPSRLADRGSHR